MLYRACVKCNRTQPYYCCYYVNRDLERPYCRDCYGMQHVERIGGKRCTRVFQEAVENPKPLKEGAE